MSFKFFIASHPLNNDLLVSHGELQVVTLWTPSHAAPGTETKVFLSWPRKPKARVGMFFDILNFDYFIILFISSTEDWTGHKKKEQAGDRFLWFETCTQAFFYFSFFGWLLVEWAQIQGRQFKKIGSTLHQPNGSTIPISWLVEKAFKPLD